VQGALGAIDWIPDLAARVEHERCSCRGAATLCPEIISGALPCCCKIVGKLFQMRHALLLAKSRRLGSVRLGRGRAACEAKFRIDVERNMEVEHQSDLINFNFYYRLVIGRFINLIFRLVVSTSDVVRASKGP
jgi:hypothetical protein